MAELTHAPANEVKRNVVLLPASPEQLESVVVNLRNLEPISEVDINGGTRLRIRYDASCVGFGDIERLLDEAGVKRPISFWWRLRFAWYRFVDANARSNALSKGGACCNRPPRGS